MQYWVPGLPQWIPALLALVALLGVNLIAVGVFGEFEFWFAIIKVVTIIGMILLGLAIILFGISALGHSASFSNLWSSGGFFPKGFKGPFLALQIVMFAFLGVELIGVTAGEAQNPNKTIPSAINKVIWRILIFYVGALVIIMSLVAWNHLNPKDSPFVVVLSRVGIPTAAGIVNFVVLTAALSSCNSGIFSTGRMLYTLAGFRQAPAALRKVSRQKVPAAGMVVSFVAMLAGVLLNYFIPASAFAYITSIATVCGLFVWGMVMFSRLWRLAKRPRQPFATLGRTGEYGGHYPDLDVPAARAVISSFLEREPAGGWLSLPEAEALLATHGIPAVASRHCRDVEGAVAVAAELGGRVVLKADFAAQRFRSTGGGS